MPQALINDAKGEPHAAAQVPKCAPPLYIVPALKPTNGLMELTEDLELKPDHPKSAKKLRKTVPIERSHR